MAADVHQRPVVFRVRMCITLQYCNGFEVGTVLKLRNVTAVLKNYRVGGKLHNEYPPPPPPPQSPLVL